MFESMRGSHSTRFQLAHGRPSDAAERDFPSKQRVECPEEA
jgi:hypothetical protein